MRNIKKMTLLLALSQLASCAVMSEKECLTADWQKIGYEVGLAGNIHKSDAFNAREKRCARVGESADSTEFDEGHSNGIVQYCQLSNAVEVGVSGANKVITDGVCPARDYPGFRRAFDVGYELHTLRSRVKKSSEAIANLRSQVNRTQQNLRILSRKAGNQSNETP